MKKRITATIAAAFLLFGGIAYAEGRYQTIEVFFERLNISVNGQEAKLTKDSILYNGSVYVPLRSLAELLDAEVYWDDANRSVYLDFLKDRKGEAYQASVEGLYQYIAIEQNRIISEMIEYLKNDDADSLQGLVSQYEHLSQVAKDLGDEKMAMTIDKMRSAVELLRGGLISKNTDDYSLAWTIFYINADALNKDLKERLSGNTKFKFEVEAKN